MLLQTRLVVLTILVSVLTLTNSTKTVSMPFESQPRWDSKRARNSDDGAQEAAKAIRKYLKKHAGSGSIYNNPREVQEYHNSYTCDSDDDGSLVLTINVERTKDTVSGDVGGYKPYTGPFLKTECTFDLADIEPFELSDDKSTVNGTTESKSYYNQGNDKDTTVQPAKKYWVVHLKCKGTKPLVLTKTTDLTPDPTPTRSEKVSEIQITFEEKDDTVEFAKLVNSLLGKTGK